MKAADARTILAVDPGVAATGIVLLVGGRIMEAHTWITKPGNVDRWQGLQSRARLQWVRIKGYIGTLPPASHIVIEAFEDFGGGHLREAHSRYYTPYLLGFVAAHVDALDFGYTIHWQSPKTVLTATRAYREHWEAGRRGLVPGDERLTNEHLRSAACHAVYLSGLLRQTRDVEVVR